MSCENYVPRGLHISTCGNCGLDHGGDKPSRKSAEEILEHLKYTVESELERATAVRVPGGMLGASVLAPILRQIFPEIRANDDNLYDQTLSVMLEANMQLRAKKS